MRINIIRPNHVIVFAAEELKKYLRMMMPQSKDVEICFNSDAKDGFRLGLLEDFGIPCEAEDPVLDDVIHIDTSGIYLNTDVQDGGLFSQIAVGATVKNLKLVNSYFRTTHVLYDRADFYGFAQLSKDSAYEGFADKTIRLGADIVVNTGSSADWADITPLYSWEPIGKSTAFAGTFDASDPVTGEIHTISGIY